VLASSDTTEILIPRKAKISACRKRFNDVPCLGCWQRGATLTGCQQSRMLRILTAHPEKMKSQLPPWHLFAPHPRRLDQSSATGCLVYLITENRILRRSVERRNIPQRLPATQARIKGKISGLDNRLIIRPGSRPHPARFIAASDSAASCALSPKSGLTCRVTPADVLHDRGGVWMPQFTSPPPRRAVIPAAEARARIVPSRIRPIFPPFRFQAIKGP